MYCIILSFAQFSKKKLFCFSENCYKIQNSRFQFCSLKRHFLRKICCLNYSTWDSNILINLLSPESELINRFKEIANEALVYHTITVMTVCC